MSAGSTQDAILGIGVDVESVFVPTKVSALKGRVIKIASGSLLSLFPSLSFLTSPLSLLSPLPPISPLSLSSHSHTCFYDL